MAKMKAVSARYDKHPRYNVPRRIYDIHFKRPAAKGDNREIAEAFLRKVAGELGLRNDLSQIRYDKTRSSPLGAHVFFQQHHQGKLISEAWVKVDVDPDGSVYGVLNELVPESFLRRAVRMGKPRSVPERDAIEVSMRHASCDVPGRAVEVLTTEEVFYPGAAGPIPAWKVVLRARDPAEEWKVYVDADSGRPLEKQSMLRYANGRGRVFDPNPVVALNNTRLESSAVIPDAAYTEVTLEGLSRSGTLDGPHVSTKLTAKRIRRRKHQFLFRRGERGFNEVMAYFHIDRAQRYIQALGFDSINNRQIEVDASGSDDDQSWYSPNTRAIHFGCGGVDDAEDADVILHEYGHSIQDDQVPGYGVSHECGSMGEAFGDYFAGSFFCDMKSDLLKPCVASWDATAYSGDDPPNLRRLDSNKKYPKDLVYRVHEDGEIFSACLWELRAALGRLAADRLILAHHFLLSRTASFEDAGKALITADRQLNDGVNHAALRHVFVRRGIFANPSRKNLRAGGRGKAA